MRKREVVAEFSPEQLTRHRTARDLSISELAERCNLHRPNLSAIEAGRRHAAFDTVIDLARALDIDPLELTTLDAAALPLSGIRLQQGVSRVQLAEATGVSYHLWWQIETGRRNLTDAVANRAAEVLDITTDDVRQALALEHHPTG